MKSSEETVPTGEQDLSEAVAVVASATDEAPAPDEDFYQELADLQRLGNSERSFTDARALLETEHLEQLGVWRPIPFLKGAEIMIAHQTTAADKREQLEAKFREKYKLPQGEALTAKQREVIWRESYCGTVVRDWRGIVLDGKPLEFSPTSFRSLMTSRRFRQFVIQSALDAEAFRAERDGALRGNS